jgi:histidinol-phosphatase (PHP family)
VRELIDGHVHTARCGHATGTAEECVREAVSAGLVSVAITEHLALPEDLDPHRHLSMSPDELDDYLAEVHAAREAFPEIEVVTGLEADFLLGREEQTAAAIVDAHGRAHGHTFVLGSVHFIGEWAFDDPHRLDEWDHHDVSQAWTDYFELWIAAVRSGLFDVMAHPDLVKKFGHRPLLEPVDLYREAAQAAADAGVAVEVSSAGLRKPVGELYPGPALLAAFFKAGVPATVGSDAHAPTEVGYRIDAAYDAMAAVGYRSVVFADASGGWKEIAL